MGEGLDQLEELKAASENLTDSLKLFANLVNYYDSLIRPGISGEKDFNQARLAARKWVVAQQYINGIVTEYTRGAISFPPSFFTDIPSDVLATTMFASIELNNLLECNNPREFGLANELDRDVAEIDFRLSVNPRYEQYRVRMELR
jgi:hypothetical protein